MRIVMIEHRASSSVGLLDVSELSPEDSGRHGSLLEDQLPDLDVKSDTLSEFEACTSSETISATESEENTPGIGLGLEVPVLSEPHHLGVLVWGAVGLGWAVLGQEVEQRELSRSDTLLVSSLVSGKNLHSE
jgi:hypothetical protein